MHIIHCVRDLDDESGGLTRAVVQLVDAIHAENVELSLCYQDRGNTIIRAAEEVRCLATSALGWRRSSAANVNFENQLQDLVEDKENVLLHMHGIWDPLTNAAAKFSQRNGVKYIWSVHGMLEPWSLSQKKLKKKLAWLSFQKRNLVRSERLHATADMERENLETLGLRTQKLVIANGIPQSPAVNIEHRKQSPRVALFLSRIHPKKGIELLIDAWKIVQPKNWVCRIIGPGKDLYIESLKQRVDRANLTKQIVLSPPLGDEEKWAAYEQASLFVLPTYSENFGIVIAEALAMKVPVITTTGTPWHSLPSEECGWYIEPTVIELANALREAFGLTNRELEQMGTKGQRYVDQNFRWPAIAHQFIDQYQQLLRI